METSSRLLLVFKKALYEVKAVVSTLVLIYFGRPWLGDTIKTNCMELQTNRYTDFRHTDLGMPKSNLK